MSSEVIPADRLFEIGSAYRRAKVLLSAVELGVFSDPGGRAARCELHSQLAIDVHRSRSARLLRRARRNGPAHARCRRQISKYRRERSLPRQGEADISRRQLRSVQSSRIRHVGIADGRAADQANRQPKTVTIISSRSTMILLAFARL